MVTRCFETKKSLKNTSIVQNIKMQNCHKTYPTPKYFTFYSWEWENRSDDMRLRPQKGKKRKVEVDNSRNQSNTIEKVLSLQNLNQNFEPLTSFEIPILKRSQSAPYFLWMLRRQIPQLPQLPQTPQTPRNCHHEYPNENPSSSTGDLELGDVVLHTAQSSSSWTLPIRICGLTTGILGVTFLIYIGFT